MRACSPQLCHRDLLSSTSGTPINAIFSSQLSHCRARRPGWTPLLVPISHFLSKWKGRLIPNSYDATIPLRRQLSVTQRPATAKIRRSSATRPANTRPSNISLPCKRSVSGEETARRHLNFLTRGCWRSFRRFGPCPGISLAPARTTEFPARKRSQHKAVRTPSP